jgi:hypothetical protein
LFAIGAAFITTKLSYPEQLRAAADAGGAQQLAEVAEKHRCSAIVFNRPLSAPEIHPKREAQRLQDA